MLLTLFAEPKPKDPTKKSYELTKEEPLQQPNQQNHFLFIYITPSPKLRVWKTLVQQKLGLHQELTNHFPP